MRSRGPVWLVVLATMLLPLGVTAQTTTPGVGIDVEVYNPVDGSNAFCVTQGVPFWANVYVRPGTGTTSCSHSCGTVSGGTSAIATAAVDLSFDGTFLDFVDAETNPDPTFAAVDGLLQAQNLATDRIGWALAGDWVVDGDTGSGLNDACTMQMLDAPGWIFRVQLVATAQGTGAITVRQPPDFALSFADMCGSPAFTLASGDIDQVVNAVVDTRDVCGIAEIFSDGFELGDTTGWTVTVP